MKECQKCGKTYEDNAKFCPGCGEPVKVESTSPFCPQCGAKIENNAKFCASCGATVGGESDLPVPAASAMTSDRPAGTVACKSSEPIPNISAMYCEKCKRYYESNASFCALCSEPLRKSKLSIEIEREERFAGMIFDYKVFIDDMEVGRICNGKSKRFEMSAGTHRLYVKLDWTFMKSNTVNFTINDGDFLKFHCDFTFGIIAALTGWAFVKSMFGETIQIEQL